MKLLKFLFLFLISATTLIGQPVNNYVPFTAAGISRSDSAVLRISGLHRRALI